MASRSARDWPSSTVSQPTVDYADVKSSNVELFLFRCPPGFDATQLDGASLQLPDGSDASSTDAGSAGGGIVIRATPDCESQELTGAFPSTKKKRWMISKAFTRQFAVSLATPPEPVTAPPPPLPPVPMVSGLRLRRPSLNGMPPPAAECGTQPPAPAPAPQQGGGGGGTPPGSRKRGTDDQSEEDRRAAKAAKKAAKAAKKAAAGGAA